jgi:PAS domain S-box-containing protein
MKNIPANPSQSSPSQQAKPLQNWREDILFLIARMVALMIVPALFIDTIISILFQEYERIFFNLGGIVVLWAVAFLQRFTFVQRVGLLFIMLYLGAIWALLSGELVGMGQLYLLLLVVFAALLCGRRLTFAIWLLSLLSLAAIYIASAAHLLPLTIAATTHTITPLNLIHSWLTQVIVSSAAGAAIILVVKHLHHSLTAAEAARTDLRHLTASLEQRVQERTVELQQTNATLRESEERFRLMADHARDIIFRYRYLPERGFDYFSPSIQTILGYAPEEFYADPQLHLKIAHPTTRQMLSSFDITSDSQKPTLLHMIHKDGHDVYLEEHFSRMYDEHGRIIAINGISRDVTERCKMEQTLQFQSHVLESIGQSVIATTLEGTVTYWNKAAEQLYGWTKDEAMGHNIMQLTPVASSQEQAREIMTYLAAGNSWAGEFLVHNRDGTTFPIWINNVPLTDEHGKLIGIIGISMDISTRKQAEEALRQSEQKYRALIENAGVLIAAYDRHGNILVFNELAAQSLGGTSSDFVGKTIFDVFSPELTNRYMQRVQQVLQSGKPDQREERVTGKDRWYLSTICPIFNDEHEQFAVQVVAHDITERKQMEEELRRAKDVAEAATRARSNFLATVSHEIRTPMNAIIGMTSLLLSTSLTNEQQDYVQTIRVSGDTLLTLINDILDFSKIEAGKLDLEYQPFSLRDVVESSLELLAPPAAEKELELAYWIDPQAPEHLIGDRTRLQQILVNLVSNAVKFTEQGDVTVTVRGQRTGISDGTGVGGQEVGCRMQGGEGASESFVSEPRPLYTIQISVQDTGIGIPADRLDKLFQAFSQVDASTTRTYGGTGLGLAICRQLVELMGGSIQVESKEGQGSTFFVRLIAEAALMPPLPFRMFDQPYLHGKRLLIVSNHPTTSQIISGYAEQWGMLATVVLSGHAALETLHQQSQFDVLLIDRTIADSSSETLITQLKARRETALLPLIRYCVLTEQQCQATTAARRGIEVLFKPVRPLLLHNTLLKLLAGESHTTFLSEQDIFDASLGQHRPLRILVAEDNAINQKVIQHLLKKLGYQADMAANGYEVLEALRLAAYDLILMDIQMPDMDGLEATTRIRRDIRTEQQPYIIALTAHILDEIREQCFAVGMDDYLGKPVRIEELIKKMQSIQGRSHPHQQDGNWQPPSAANQPTTAPLDDTVYEQFIALTRINDTGKDAAHELVQLFLQEAPPKIATMQQAITQGEAHTLRFAAHTLKSSSAQLGAIPLSILCKELETLGKASNLTDAAKLLTQLETEFERLNKALHEKIANA